MTLNEWIEKYNIKVSDRLSSRDPVKISEDACPTDQSVFDLWHLDDFLVSSVLSGPSILLVPKVHTR